MPTFLTPFEVDEMLKLSKGRAKRLAKRGMLPAIILPDGTIRFNADILREHLSKPGVVSK